MAIVAWVINEFYEIISEVGSIESNDFETILEVAAELDMKCLSLADYVGDTFFNEKQMRCMQKEVDILRTHSAISKSALDIIQKGIDEGLKDMFLYLKFEGE